ncbi:MAG: hypothetical protein A2V66_09505 [Ignavibacteria bacterium RBG_13_36_8]|nr:MAG: hypothetical protein A2V66_09505 [Ignavibacteria bacterium RBG_13_36_8]
MIVFNSGFITHRRLIHKLEDYKQLQNKVKARITSPQPQKYQQLIHIKTKTLKHYNIMSYKTKIKITNIEPDKTTLTTQHKPCVKRFTKLNY